MLTGWTETPQQIEARKRRILRDVRQPAVKILPAMTRQEYDALPEIVRYFLTWERARRPMKVTDKRAADRRRKVS